MVKTFFSSPELFHQDFDKVALAEHDVVLQSPQVVQESETIEEKFEQSCRRLGVRQSDGALKFAHVGVM